MKKTLNHTTKANCIGYAALFNSIANYLIEQSTLKSDFEAKHLIGKMFFLGIDLHQFFNNLFFRDHDFNWVKNLESGEVVYIDPSVSDYLMIDRISFNSK